MLNENPDFVPGSLDFPFPYVISSLRNKLSYKDTVQKSNLGKKQQIIKKDTFLSDGAFCFCHGVFMFYFLL